MFLKTEKFGFNGEDVTLYELSALQRIEFIGYAAKLSKEIPEDADDDVRLERATVVSVKVGARIVAMSLWQADIKGSSVDELQQQVLATWPLPAISQADFSVRALSGMLPPEPDAGDADAPASEEDVTPEKSTPAS